MIERKFKDSVRLFGHDVFISEDEKYAVTNPHIFLDCTQTINLLEFLEERSYGFLFAEGSALYFRRREI